jgi:asparagine synthase (glutamine-hydrolysing)
MAEQMQARFQPVPVDQAALATHFADATWHCETLSVNTHSVAKYLLSRAVRDAGFKVVLTGEGADDVLAGYEHFRMDVLLHEASEEERVRGLAALKEDSRRVAGMMTPTGEHMPVDKAQRMLGFVPSWFRAKTSLGLRARQLLDDAFVKEYGQVDVLEKLLNRLDLAGQVNGRTKLDQALYLYEKSSLPNYVLSVLGDRMEMAHSIEARLPFLDHPLVEFAVNLPPRLKIRLSDASEKFVLREAVKGIVPDAVRTRKKRGFLGPWSFRTRQRDLEILMQDTLRGTSLPPCYDRKRMTTLLDRLPRMDSEERTPYEPVLTMAMSVCFLQERFNLCE